ncbi:hypothetical protein D3C73_859740 [compost metagenome]
MYLVTANFKGGAVLRVIPQTLHVFQTLAVGRDRQETAFHVADFSLNRFAGPFQPHRHMGGKRDRVAVIGLIQRFIAPHIGDITVLHFQPIGIGYRGVNAIGNGAAALR